MKFENGNYNKIWEANEGRKVISTILTEEGFIKPNYTFYLEKFKIDPTITPTNHKGEAIFTSEMRELVSADLMDMRTPLGETRVADKAGIAYYTGRIPDFAPAGFVEKATERWYKEENFAQFGDAALIAQFATNELQRMIDSANMTLSYLAAKALSTGETIYDMGDGIQSAIYKSYIPEENFVNAGEKVWSDPSAKILDQMSAIEESFKDKWGAEMPMQWEMTQEMFDAYFLKNEQVKEWVKYLNVVNNTPLPENLTLTRELVEKAIPQHPYNLSPIVIVNEKQKDINQGVVRGWKAGNAVLRPRGYAGYIRRASILDEVIYKRYANSVNSYNFTPALNGLGVFMNSVVVNGNFKEWHTDLFVKAIPTLDEFLYHIIVDTTTAG
ncbi:MAG: major capsid protein [Bacteroidales bacterium]|nr:major capsid protein [Bacteroidales bacterium]